MADDERDGLINLGLLKVALLLEINVLFGGRVWGGLSFKQFTLYIYLSRSSQSSRNIILK